MRILLVDDSRVMRDIAQRVLLEAWPAARIRQADDVGAALRCIAEAAEPFALAMVGWRADGAEVVASLRAALNSMPILVMAAQHAQTQMIDAIRAGASNYVYKPFTPDELIHKTKATLARANPGRIAA